MDRAENLYRFIEGIKGTYALTFPLEIETMN